MKFAYRDRGRMHNETRLLLGKITRVLNRYQAEGYKLTLRQLYYQLVVENVFANKQSNYSKLSTILGEARMCGEVDWEVIEDRIRVPKFPNEWGSIDDAMKTLIHVYRRERWAEQENYVEAWVEKDALSGVLEPITNDYHIHLLVCRGYSSISAMHDSALRFREHSDKDCYLLYFGDHDPSGEDMVRDIDGRLAEFGADVEVRKIALTKDQVNRYKLPPNPAKSTDPRARDYIAEHGRESWELDALPPETLRTLLTDALDDLVDKGLYEQVKEQEESDKAKMKNFGKRNAT